jgi:hypothetical protein
MKKSFFRNAVLFAVMATVFVGSFGCSDSGEVKTELLIVGGGASGTAAAIQAARMGTDVLIVESSPWLGGMLTAAGVSAIDGNHQMPSGIWGEFREKLYNHYGGAVAVATGWVSNTLYEPEVGERILREMVEKEPNITIKHGWYVEEVSTSNGVIQYIRFSDLGEKSLLIKPEIVIEATEYGDVIALAGEDYSIGLEPKSETGESVSPDTLISWPQDLTYVATLVDTVASEENIVLAPDSYDPSLFDCLCKEVCDDEEKAKDLMPCQNVLNYGKLPEDQYMINWPNQGNDTYLEILELTHKERLEKFEIAKNKTRSWIHFMQTEAGMTNLKISERTYPTEDDFALKPYIRESRRLYGDVRLTLPDIRFPYENTERPLYKAAVAVGDYPVDHHRRLNPEPLILDFPKIPSYSVPFNVMIPQNTQNLIVAEKSISVTSVVNGTTRLQPVVIQIGQAAGAAAALALKNDKTPAEVNIRNLQTALLEADNWLMPYMDTNPTEEYFQSAQRAGLAGWMRGEGIPFKWANETRFHPEKSLMALNFLEITERMGFSGYVFEPGTEISRYEFLRSIYFMLKERNHVTGSADEAVTYFLGKYPDHPWFAPSEEEKLSTASVTRYETAFWLDQEFSPFSDDLTIDFVK